ncbi:unnamed protein product, partial [Ceratitis capitata]
MTYMDLLLPLMAITYSHAMGFSALMKEKNRKDKSDDDEKNIVEECEKIKIFVSVFHASAS